ncbi:MAG: hypothetical protein AAGN64_16010 [Bacteroidota bacterium]
MPFNFATLEPLLHAHITAAGLDFKTVKEYAGEAASAGEAGAVAPAALTLPAGSQRGNAAVITSEIIVIARSSALVKVEAARAAFDLADALAVYLEQHHELTEGGAWAVARIDLERGIRVEPVSADKSFGIFLVACDWHPA